MPYIGFAGLSFSPNRLFHPQAQQGNESPSANIVFLASVIEAFAEVIRIDKLLAGIVRRVNINHLDLPVVTLLQKLEHFQVVAFYKQVLSLVKIYRLLAAGLQGCVTWLLYQNAGNHACPANPYHNVHGDYQLFQ